MKTAELRRIAAFIPHYEKDIGQGIKILYRDGKTGFLQLGMRSFLVKAARLFTVSLRESRRRYGLLLGRKNLVPLVLAPYLVYVPLKTTVPAVAGDPAYGYFRLRSISEVRREPEPCTLFLEGGHILTICQSYRGACRHLRAARKLENILLAELFQSMDSCSEDNNCKLYLCSVCKKCLLPSK